MSHIPKFGDASKSLSGDAASPAGDVGASPNCGICDTAVKLNPSILFFILFSQWPGVIFVLSSIILLFAFLKSRVKMNFANPMDMMVCI